MAGICSKKASCPVQCLALWHGEGRALLMFVSCPAGPCKAAWAHKSLHVSTELAAGGPESDSSHACAMRTQPAASIGVNAVLVLYL